MYACTTGKHHWTRQEDAAKCCNGFTRCLFLDDLPSDAEIKGVLHGKLYGFAWRPTETRIEEPRPQSKSTRTHFNADDEDGF